MLRVGSRVVEQCSCLRQAIVFLWLQHRADGAFCTRPYPRLAHFYKDPRSELLSSAQGNSSELGFSQHDEEDTLAMAAVEGQKEEEGGLSVCSAINKAETHRVLRIDSLSRRLLKLPPHSPVAPSLQKWRAEGQALTKNIIVNAIFKLKREGRYSQAYELADDVWKERIYVMDDVDHMYRLYLLGQMGTVEDVEKCFASIPTKWLTEKVYNQLISFYIKRDMLPQAENTLERLKYSGQSISAVPFNQFMSLYRNQREPKKALELIKEMNMSNVVPNTRTYNILLSIINKHGDADEVILNYRAMKDAGIAPDILTFSLVAKAYISAGMLDEAEALAHVMKQEDSKNSHLVHDLMLTVYADQKRPDDLRRVWKDVEKKSKISGRSYGVMIESLGKLGLVQEAEKVACKAEKIKRKLPLQVCNSLMDVYQRHGMMDAAEQLLLRLQKEGLRANCTTYKHIVVGYLKIGQFVKAAEYLRVSKKELQYEYSRPLLESFVVFLDFLAEKGEVEMAEQIIKYVSKPMNISTYNALLKAYVKAQIKVPDFLARMSADGVLPDAKTLALLSELESM